MTDLRYLFENLFINQYDIKYVKRPEQSVMQVTAVRKDEFGFGSIYQFFFLSKLLPASTIEHYRRPKEDQVFIGVEGQAGADLTENGFFDKLNTLIDPGIYLNPDLKNILTTLGHNQLPAGMSGKADDLLEMYVKDCIQFLLAGKGRRYGRERSFEPLPDGAILGKDMTVLFDAKAYKNGFKPSADDVKRFCSYVTDFNTKYGHYGHKVFCFAVISGHFDVGEEALEDRSRELYELCHTTIAFISADELSGMVAAVLSEASYRHAVNWKKILSKPVTRCADLTNHINTIKKDKII